MSVYGKLRKNAENFMIQDVCNKMTPEQYRKGINYAVEKTKKEMIDAFAIERKNLENEYNRLIKANTSLALDTISVELLYELTNQMGYWECEDKEVLESIKYRVKDIYEKTMETIKKYGKYKNENQANREFKKRKNTMEKIYNIRF